MILLNSMSIQTYTWYLCYWPPTKTSNLKNNPHEPTTISITIEDLLHFAHFYDIFVFVSGYFSSNFNVICSVSFHSYLRRNRPDLKDSCVFLRQRRTLIWRSRTCKKIIHPLQLDIEVDRGRKTEKTIAFKRGRKMEKVSSCRRKDMVVLVGDRRDKGLTGTLVKGWRQWI